MVSAQKFFIFIAETSEFAPVPPFRVPFIGADQVASFPVSFQSSRANTHVTILLFRQQLESIFVFILW